ncbi:MAG: methyltransferase domain-containing protein [Actinobacteria bacterium]|nr:methyltransferase domain-containing protein [Actinomycetota bacterium]
MAPAPAARSAYFDRLYARQADPWQLATRFYEQRKRALQLACLPRPRFRRAFEPGCALGLLTEELAARCDELVATDAAKAAVRQTRVRVGEADHVRIGQGRIPDQWPDGTFDLIVISEVGYYCPDLDALRRRIGTSLTEDGVLLACHWRHPAPDHPHGAGPVHEALGTDLLPLVRHVEQDFLLDVWSRSGVSVATSEGVLD